MHTRVIQLSYQIICNTTGVTSGEGTASSTRTPVDSWVLVGLGVTSGVGTASSTRTPELIPGF